MLLASPYADTSDVPFPVRVVTHRDVLWNTASVSALVVHVQLFADMYPWQWVPQLRATWARIPIAIITDRFVYDSLYMEVLARLSSDASIDVVYAEPSEQRTALHAIWRAWGMIDRDVDHRVTRGVIVTTLGGAPRDGATSTALSVACALAQHTSLRIGLLDLHLKSPELSLIAPQTTGQYAHIGIRAQLHTGALAPHTLWELCAPYKPSLRILHGTPRRDTAGDVTPSMIQTLMHTARQTFDITIIDVSAIPDNAATICAVREADVRLLITTQSVRSYMWSVGAWFACFWNTIGVDVASMRLVVNRVVPEEERPERIASLLGAGLLTTVPRVAASLCHKAERDRIPLYALGDVAYARAIHMIANALCTHHGTHTSIDVPKTRTGVLAKFMGSVSKGASA